VVVEKRNGPNAPIYRSQGIITGWVKGRSPALKAKDANRITLLRDTEATALSKREPCL